EDRRPGMAGRGPRLPRGAPLPYGVREAPLRTAEADQPGRAPRTRRAPKTETALGTASTRTVLRSRPELAVLQRARAAGSQGPARAVAGTDQVPGHLLQQPGRVLPGARGLVAEPRPAEEDRPRRAGRSTGQAHRPAEPQGPGPATRVRCAVP